MCLFTADKISMGRDRINGMALISKLVLGSEELKSLIRNSHVCLVLNYTQRMESNFGHMIVRHS